MKTNLVTGIALALFTSALLLVATSSAQTGTPSKPPVVHHKTAIQPPQQDDGERIFAQNCSRCHTTPDGFSSRISGTIVRHMRVRANLSKHDEEQLLRFFNP